MFKVHIVHILVRFDIRWCSSPLFYSGSPYVLLRKVFKIYDGGRPQPIKTWLWASNQRASFNHQFENHSRLKFRLEKSNKVIQDHNSFTKSFPFMLLEQTKSIGQKTYMVFISKWLIPLYKHTKTRARRQRIVEKWCVSTFSFLTQKGPNLKNMPLLSSL